MFINFAIASFATLLWVASEALRFAEAKKQAKYYDVKSHSIGHWMSRPEFWVQPLLIFFAILLLCEIAGD